MGEVLDNEGLLRDCIKNTSSAIKYNGSKIKYYDFITKLENDDKNNQLVEYKKLSWFKRLFNKISRNFRKGF